MPELGIVHCALSEVYGSYVNTLPISSVKKRHLMFQFNKKMNEMARMEMRSASVHGRRV